MALLIPAQGHPPRYLQPYSPDLMVERLNPLLLDRRRSRVSYSVSKKRCPMPLIGPRRLFHFLFSFFLLVLVLVLILVCDLDGDIGIEVFISNRFLLVLGFATTNGAIDEPRQQGRENDDKDDLRG